MGALAGDCINIGVLKSHFGAIRLPGGAQVAPGVSQVRAAFRARLATTCGGTGHYGLNRGILPSREVMHRRGPPNRERGRRA
jgi:hypothetical protein